MDINEVIWKQINRCVEAGSSPDESVFFNSVEMLYDLIHPETQKAIAPYIEKARKTLDREHYCDTFRTIMKCVNGYRPGDIELPDVDFGNAGP